MLSYFSEDSFITMSCGGIRFLTWLSSSFFPSSSNFLLRDLLWWVEESMCVLYKSLKKKPVYKQQENKIGRERGMEVTQIHHYNPYKSLEQLTTTTTCFPYWKNTINKSIFFFMHETPYKLAHLHNFFFGWRITCTINAHFTIFFVPSQCDTEYGGFPFFYLDLW